VGAEIAEPGGGEEGITRRVARDVGIRVPCQTAFPWPGQPGEPQLALRLAREGVHIDTDARARHTCKDHGAHPTIGCAQNRMNHHGAAR
jgi:hypothetical protein